MKILSVDIVLFFTKGETLMFLISVFYSSKKGTQMGRLNEEKVRNLV
jgi:hypothetical protein